MIFMKQFVRSSSTIDDSKLLAGNLDADSLNESSIFCCSLVAADVSAAVADVDGSKAF
ncbi:uncharacterized protein ASCRUDRAFT_78781 [Ascoidea rubescens DSM 1968]|uniref:Uncharacterized protein n=1 Tax=Ascoidea rubescens DSM 1968 TaxID=1344418 RepID=A0A1D2VQ92_9ASCO|nr:hypothetical protein ASCRUDRAFT_78781 [Ascoidea rubescens DSM 1968]ODV63754.1 hypothetical protein ASCRUDRAFT_78781 [Ascoidea rubescens DSM 1968]